MTIVLVNIQSFSKLSDIYMHVCVYEGEEGSEYYVCVRVGLCSSHAVSHRGLT